MRRGVTKRLLRHCLGRWTCRKMCQLQMALEFGGLLVSRATPECW